MIFESLKSLFYAVLLILFCQNTVLFRAYLIINMSEVFSHLMQLFSRGLLYWALLGYTFDAPGYEPAAMPLVWHLPGALFCGCALKSPALALL